MSTVESKERTRVITVRVPESLHARLKEHVRDINQRQPTAEVAMSMNYFCARAIEAELNKTIADVLAAEVNAQKGLE